MKTLEDFLAHHGVLGMRWGFRKAGTGAPSSHKKGAGVAYDKAKANKAQAKIGRRGNTDKLNNDELQHLVNRLNLEKQYTSLASGKSSKSSFSKILTDVGHNVLRKQLQSAANDIAAKKIKAALKQKGLA